MAKSVADKLNNLSSVSLDALPFLLSKVLAGKHEKKGSRFLLRRFYGV
jgi:hypothetical protein